jgi:hypothetical protein
MLAIGRIGAAILMRGDGALHGGIIMHHVLELYPKLMLLRSERSPEGSVMSSARGTA